MNMAPKKKPAHPWQALYESSLSIIRAYILEKQKATASSENTKALLVKGHCYN